MECRSILGMMLTLLLVSTLTLAFNVRPVQTDSMTLTGVGPRSEAELDKSMPVHVRTDHSAEGGFYESGMTQVVSTESPFGSYHPSLAIDSKGNVHVAWHDLTDLECGVDLDIFYKRYEVGTGWTETEVVSTESSDTSAYPSLAVDLAGNVHIAWHDNTTDLAGSGADWDIFYKRYEVGGDWSGTEAVSTDSIGNSFFPSLAVDLAGNVHIAWHDETDYVGSGIDWDIFYKKYRVGVGWTYTEVVSINNKDSFNPSLAVDSSGNIHIAWEDYTGGPGSGNDLDIFYRRLDVGFGWSETEVVSTESAEASHGPSMAVGPDGFVHVAWEDETDYGSGSDKDIFYKNRTYSWSTTEVVSTESHADSWAPSLAVDIGRSVHIAWDDRNGLDWTVFYKRFGVGGGWTPTQAVSTESIAHSWVASLAVDSSRNVHIAWQDETDYAGCGVDVDVFYKYLRLHSTQHSWTMFRYNLWRSGFTESPAPRTNQTQWTFTADGWVESSPAVADGKVFVGSNDGNLYALDQHTGAYIWDYTTGGAVWSSPAVAYGKVYVGSADYKVYCLDASTGMLIWNYTTSGIVRSSPAVSDGRVYVGSDIHKVYCLNAATGAHIWNYTTDDMIYLSSPAVAEGKVYIGSINGTIYCLDASTGSLGWTRTTGGWSTSSPTVSDDKVYVASGAFDRNIYCLDASTGMLIWNYTASGPTYSSPAIAYGKVYAGSWDNRTYCLDAATGTHIWNYTLGGFVFSSPAVANGKVYVGSGDGKVYCLDALAGTPIWTYATGNDIISSPAVSDGMVFVGSKDNSVYAIGSIIRVPEDYPTIQEAIDAADSGDTIIVAPGTYNESLVINKTLTILGLEGSSTDFAGGGSGIAVTIQPDAPGTIIDNVVITNWDQGIFINDTSDCQIYGNVMYYMSDSGIVVKGNNAANNLIEDNVIYSNNIAINVTKSATSNIIYNNTITANNVGLYLESGGNLIYNNTISQNNVGINMDNSDNNIIYHNNFVDNTNAQVITSTSINNDWDNGSEGNYWSDYTGTDADGDGIGDTPYIIDGSNQDDYPLMSPYEYWSNPMCGDVNKDMKVNAQDLLFLAAAYGATSGKENWHPNCDFNNDNKIDALDLIDLCKNYGRTA